jgi:hypothetical protein
MPDEGEYVLATKWNDGDPGDAWAVGFYDCERDGRHFVKDGNGNNIRAGGYRRVARITAEYGNWLLGMAAPILEKSPPGTVSLWGMGTPRAFGQDQDASSSGTFGNDETGPLDETAKLT